MAKNQAHLLFTRGPRKGEHVLVPESGLRIGREAINDLRITDDLLSRTHCRLFFRGGQLWVMDEQSANGTQRNGQRIATSELVRGDVVTIGNTEIQVLRHTLEATPDMRYPWRYRSTPPPAGGAPPTNPASSHGSFLGAVGGIALIAWWLLLAYSLCLPPPPGSDAAPSLEVGAVPPLPETPEPPPPAPATAPQPETPEPPPEAPPPLAAEAEAPPDSDTALMRGLRANVAQLLLGERYADADAALATPAISLTADEQAELEALKAFTAGIQEANARIATALGAQAAKRITLRNGATNLAFKVTAVSGAKMHGSVISAAGEKRVALDVAKLHPADRLKWLGTPDTPEASALGCVLAQRSGDRATAQRFAANSGLLSEALQEALAAQTGGGP